MRGSGREGGDGPVGRDLGTACQAENEMSCKTCGVNLAIEPQVQEQF